MKRNPHRAALRRWTGLALCLLALGQFSARGQARLTKAGWQLEPSLSDDFNDTLPLSAKWTLLENKDTTQNSFSSYNTWDNVSKRNGCVVLQTKKQPRFDAGTGLRYHYSTASLVSKYDEYPGVPADKNPGGLLYGMYEIRCKVPRKAGQYPCFWLNGQTAWPPEIDVFEYNGLKPTSFFSTVHYRNPAYRGTPPRDLAAGTTYWFPYALADEFHTWTVVWTPTEITWFFEGREMQRDTVAEHVPGSATWGINGINRWELYRWEQMHVVFGASLNYPNGAEEEFDDFLVDYVHVYKPAALPRYTSPPPQQNLAEYVAAYYDGQVLPAYRNTPYTTSAAAQAPAIGPPGAAAGLAEVAPAVCKLAGWLNLLPTAPAALSNPASARYEPAEPAAAARAAPARRLLAWLFGRKRLPD